MGEASLTKALGLAVATAIGLSACSGPRYSISRPVTQGPAPPSSPPALSPAPSRAPPRQAELRPKLAQKDACGAAGFQGLVGRPKTEIPIPLDPSRQRVACTNCPGADDVDPARLNFLFDANSGLIREVRCG